MTECIYLEVSSRVPRWKRLPAIGDWESINLEMTTWPYLSACASLCCTSISARQTPWPHRLPTKCQRRFLPRTSSAFGLRKPQHDIRCANP